MKREKANGITLIALVVTIVVLIILATISINAVFGENGIIKRAEAAKRLHEQAIRDEENNLNELLNEYEEALPKPDYIDEALPTAPRVTEGMTRIKWNAEMKRWEKVRKNDEEWYDYNKKEWANVVLGDSTFIVENGVEVLDESKPYSQLVWIPRFAYQITSMYHYANENEAGNIEVVFVDSKNTSKDGKATYKTTYPTITDLGTANGKMDDYVVHPAFNYGGTSLTGFWVGKYETSNRNCTLEKASGEQEYTGEEIITIMANVTGWRTITIGNAFTASLNMNKQNNVYNLSSNDKIVDPHMAKNDEWGAIAYLSKSNYGSSEEIWPNTNGNYITGMAGTSQDAVNETETNLYYTEKGVKASTTGNVYGVYDLSGGNFERTAAYVDDGAAYLNQYGEELVKGESKYKNVYQAEKQWTAEDPDTMEGNYALSTPENGHYGDAIYEISLKATEAGGYSWYNDRTNFPYGTSTAGIPFFGRGGWSRENPASSNGLFYFRNSAGGPWGNDGFRIVISVF